MQVEVQTQLPVYQLGPSLLLLLLRLRLCCGCGCGCSCCSGSGSDCLDRRTDRDPMDRGLEDELVGSDPESDPCSPLEPLLVTCLVALLATQSCPAQVAAVRPALGPWLKLVECSMAGWQSRVVVWPVP